MKKALITIIGLMLAVLFGYGIAHAETSLYAIGEQPGAGYEIGYGILAEHTQRYNRFGFNIKGQFANQKKENADSGYTYKLQGELRGFFKDDFYLAIGYKFSGYESKFSNTVWKKHGTQPFFGVGFDTNWLDAWFSYFLKENDTPNEVSAIKLGATWKPDSSRWKIFTEVTRMEFTQSNKRLDDIFVTLGIGLEF